MPDGDALQPTPGQGNPQGVAGEPANTQPPGAPAPPTDWEARFKGLQPLFQQEQQKRITLESLVTQHTQTVEQLRQQIGSLEANTATAQEALAERDDTLESLQFDLQTQQAENQKFRMIASEFPNLLAFSAHIPTVVDEAEQKEALQEWQDLVAKEIDAQVQTKVSDAVRASYPTASPARGADAIPKMEDVLKTLEETAGNPQKKEEYQQALQWRDQLEAKGN